MRAETNKVLAFSHLGVMFAITLGGSTYLGLLADKRCGTTPLLTLLGVLLGFGAAFYNLYRGVYGPGGAAERDRSEHDDDPSGPPHG